MKKGRRDYHLSFVGLERKMLFKCNESRQLSARAKIVYTYLKAAYNSRNNGEIQLFFSALADQPDFKSKKAFYGATKELIQTGWIERTKNGGLFRNANAYRLTGKYDGML